MTRRSLTALCLLLPPLVLLTAVPARAFDLQFTVSNQATFSANQLSILNTALARVESMWESRITGYQAGISIPSVSITVFPSTSGLASANFSSTTFQGGFTLATSGFININYLELENFANWQGVPGPPTFKPPTNLNYIDELLAHETGHVLGVGTLWSSNGLYSSGTYQYHGQYGVAAYKDEFDANATFLPVENAGNAGTPDAHWDQLMRSSPQEGNPSDPWSLDPRVFVTDHYGRDRGFELMTGAIDPDFGEPFVSRTTIESMRDMGYTVTRFEDFNGDGAVNTLDRDILLAHMGATGLQVDSMTFGDANRDRVVDSTDFALWRAAAAPEPATVVLAAMAVLATLRRRK